MEDKKKFYKVQRAVNTKVTCEDIARLPAEHRAGAIKTFVGMHVKAALKASGWKIRDNIQETVWKKQINKLAEEAYPLTNIQ